jgi:type I restriction enzyme, R subunit
MRKAMVVTGSRKEAVRYKLEFDKYVQKEAYSKMSAMVAFSGEVTLGAGDPTFMPNAEADMKTSKRELDALGIFKSELVAFTRYYEFMSQIVDYDSHDLERLSLYARHLAPMLREKAPDERPHRLVGAVEPLPPVEDYAHTIRDKVSENEHVMNQIANNSPEQALLGDFAGALDEAVMESGEAHENQMMQYLNSKELQAKFQRLIFDMVLAKRAELDKSTGSL